MGVLLEGFDDLIANTNNMAKTLEIDGESPRTIGGVLKRAAKPIEEEMLNITENDPEIISGNLHGSIKIGGIKHSTKRGKYITIGVHRKEWAKTGEPDYYPAYVEYGHGGPRPAPPHPYVRKAYDIQEDRAYELIRSGLRELLSISIKI